MNSIKAKVIYLSISTFLLFGYVGFSYWAPNYVETLYESKVPLERRISILESAVDKAKSGTPFTQEQMTTFFTNQINTEISNDALFASIINFFNIHPNILLGLLFLHLGALASLIQALVVKKT